MTKKHQLILLEILIETLDENMEHYEEFKYTGLNNCDYIDTGFYESGFGESVIVTNNE